VFNKVLNRLWRSRLDNINPTWSWCEWCKSYTQETISICNCWQKS